jgi:hypothetical protein
VERKAQKRVSRVGAENTVVLASTREDAEGLVQKIALLEGELEEACRAREVPEENSRGLFDMAADAERRWKVSERERREHFEELTHL